MIENLQIYRDASELIKRVFIIVKQFPRDYKYTIGTRIQNTALDCIDLIYRASRHKNKQEDLDNLVASLDFLSYLIRISKDMNIVTERQYGLYIERSVPCVKQASGWLKSQSINSYYGMMRHINCYNLRKSIALRNKLNMIKYEKLALKSI
jgi:hypothetical protein